MTRHESFSDFTIAEKDLVLATDLDGTFLGGYDADRKQFYAWIEANRDRVGLIFVTGRDPSFIRELTYKGHVPRPDYVVADVGTTIAEMDHTHILSPIDVLEAEIADAWKNSNDRVQRALHGMAGLKLQSTMFRYRVSYDMDPYRLDPKAVATVEDLGLDVLISDDRFFDVLPKGVSKGPSLLRLLTHLGIDNRKTLVAGDTLNDYSMLAMGVPAVAVGNSEPALVEKVKDLDHVRIAEDHGVAGIAEAIVKDQLFPKA
ncbi:HAD-IIB family hydrolase [Marivita hallyeonensis]|uniref:HAD-superfamily hydrolase, subfamily IIB n=1 Tax=Marivita hallyeonensis TaxID=996342 RepID=A0A1M5P1H3_9RHOB|nr:HAD-IIB family hydrolase [Marivita hallyeonensis]SHG95557.1 HAD-superfamily hydrolase, subfamily IIB [Marivita hallyeonensis]